MAKREKRGSGNPKVVEMPVKAEKVKEIWRRWGVELRTAPVTVETLLRGSVTLSPELFACYEAALKAIYANWQYTRFDLGVMLHYQELFGRAGIGMPYIWSSPQEDGFEFQRGETPANWRSERIERGRLDYSVMAAVIGTAGLYYHLLD